VGADSRNFHRRIANGCGLAAGVGRFRRPVPSGFNDAQSYVSFSRTITVSTSSTCAHGAQQRADQNAMRCVDLVRVGAASSVRLFGVRHARRVVATVARPMTAKETCDALRAHYRAHHRARYEAAQADRAYLRLFPLRRGWWVDVL
jgi:hypothetical protein